MPRSLRPPEQPDAGLLQGRRQPIRFGDRGDLIRLPRRELRAVIGHEIGHVKNRDILISSIAATIGGAITFLTGIFIMTTAFHIGAIYWYIFLSATYGLFSAYAVVLAFGAFTLMIRLFRAIVR